MLKFISNVVINKIINYSVITIVIDNHIIIDNFVDNHI